MVLRSIDDPSMRPAPRSRLAAFLAAFVAATALAQSPAAGPAGDDAYLHDLAAWRARVDAGLRRDNGWLTLVGRHVLRYGDNTIGSAPGNDVVLDAAIAPPKLATIRVGERHVRIDLAPDVAMHPAGEPARTLARSRTLSTDPGSAEWLARDRLAFQVIRRDDGQAVLRVADNGSPLRANFAGRVWFEPDAAKVVPATFTPAPAGTKIPIANVLNEISLEDAVGSVAFELDGKPMRFDAVGNADTLFIIFRDATAGDSTYPPGRFLVVRKPKDGRWVVDFNRAYNPPCAFSAYTSCPLPPPQNVLATRIEAGEKYRGR